MRQLDRSRPPRVVCDGGSVQATKVVLALNAWAAALPELRRSLVVIGSDIVLTPPIPGRLTEIGWTDGLAISDSRLLVNYYRTTRDGRVAFGQGGGMLAFSGRVGDRFDGKSPRERHVTRSFHDIYPSLAGVEPVTSWMGPIDRSMIGLPFFSALESSPEIVYGVGYSGNGVGPSVIGGRILASLVLDRDDEWSRSGLVGDQVGRFPPEPLRYMGGHIVRAAVARKEAAEDAGRRPSHLSVGIAGLAPAGLVPVKKDI
jgi:glycine/D-amino acid oxidase-like deaminating enzyme